VELLEPQAVLQQNPSAQWAVEQEASWPPKMAVPQAVPCVTSSAQAPPLVQ
jgi:hypothetical protein